MSKPKVIGWFDRLETAYQFAVICMFFLGIFASGLSIASAVSLRVMKTIIREETLDIREMALFNLKESGRLDDFIRFREKQKHDQEIMEGRRADSGRN